MLEKYWKKVFRADIKTKLVYADKEYNKYKSTGRLIYLQQAGNKLFSAVENYMMLKYSQRARSYEAVKGIITDARDKKLLVDAAQLHYFYYNAELQMSRSDAESYYKDVYNKMNDRLG